MARKRAGRRTLVLICLAFAQLVVTEAALPIVTSLASAKLPSWLAWLKPDSSRPWWVLGLLLLVVLLAAAWQSRERRGGGEDSDPDPPPPRPVPDWAVGRPAEASQVVDALKRRRRRRGYPAEIASVLYGAGGFGKTVLAEVVCADPKVRDRFGDRAYWVTVGRDAQGSEAIAAKANDAVELITGKRPSYANAREASQNLSRVMEERPRSLLVLDDVWTEDQLAPFLAGAPRWGRLITTRMPGSSLPGCHAVEVGLMTTVQARAILTNGLPSLGRAVADQLLEAASRWPLLLRLINQFLVDQADLGADTAATCGDLLDRLRARGPGAVDIPARKGRTLDLDDPDQRSHAVRATIDASTGLLDDDEVARLNELGVFAADESVPAQLVTRLWQITSGTDAFGREGLCKRLADLGLVTLKDATVSCHDVIRDFLRHQVGDTRLTQLNGLLLDAVAADLPPAEPLVPGSSTASVAWWQLPAEERYVRDNVVRHLIEAGRRDEADALACDLRWIVARLTRSGINAPIGDLALVGTPHAMSLMRSLTRTAHLLDAADPEDVIFQSVLGALRQNPDAADQATALEEVRAKAYLVSRWPLPDVSDPALTRILEGYSGGVKALAVAPDGSWLAAAGSFSSFGDYSVRVWDPLTGASRVVMGSRNRLIKALAVAPDGSWLASAGGFFSFGDYSVRVWDPLTGASRAILGGHNRVVTAFATLRAIARTIRFLVSDELGYFNVVRALAVAPDGSWLASAGHDEKVRVWDPVTGAFRAALKGHTKMVIALAVAPDGSWLASAGHDKTVRVWDPLTWASRAVLKGHTGVVGALAVAPDGSWLASASFDNTVRVWDPLTWASRAVLKGHTGSVDALAVAPDGSWLASASFDDTVRVWDPLTGACRAVLQGHTSMVKALAVAPDGSWLASAGLDDMVRVWDPVAVADRAVPVGRTKPVKALAVAPDGSWLASGSDGWTVQVWNPLTGVCQDVLQGHGGAVNALVVAPDGSWLASASDDKTVRVWDPLTWASRAILEGHTDTVNALVVAADGSWLASASDDKTVRVWDPLTWASRAVLEGHTHAVRVLAVAPDGSWLASAGGRLRPGNYSVRVWDPLTGATRAVLTGHLLPVFALAVAPDGSWLASAGFEGTVRVWDPLAGPAVRTDESGLVAFARVFNRTKLSVSQRKRVELAAGCRAVLEGHTGWVNALAVARDGSWLASASRDGTVRVWDPLAGQQAAVVKTANPLSCCKSTPDGHGIAVGGESFVHLFDLHLAE